MIALQGFSELEGKTLSSKTTGFVEDPLLLRDEDGFKINLLKETQRQNKHETHFAHALHASFEIGVATVFITFQWSSPLQCSVGQSSPANSHTRCLPQYSNVDISLGACRA